VDIYQAAGSGERYMRDWPTEHEGTLAGPYVVNDVIDRDGLSSLYQGRTAIGEKQVELKFVSAEYLQQSLIHGMGRNALIHEYRTAVQLGPKHVSRHISTGYCASGQPFLAREPRIDSGPKEDGKQWPFMDAASLVLDVAEGVLALHEMGLIGPTLTRANLEVFPANPHDATRGRLRDLTALRWRDLPAPVAGPSRPTTLTPEGAAGDHLDERSDIFALGRLFYTLLAGQDPFSTASARLENLSHLYGSDESLPSSKLASHRSDLAEEVDMFLVRALHRSPDVRPQTVQHFLSGVQHLVGLSD
jgi:eukaryotic-like serine/threonine-protein kinase